MTAGDLRAAPHGPSLALYAPPPREPGAGHDGLKLDWGSPVGRTGALLTWSTATPPVDAGVPPEVAGALARALCAVGTVAGCTAELPAAVGAEWTPVAAGHAVRYPRARWRREAELGLLASRDPDVVVGLFDAAGYPWWHEQQALFLSAPGALPRLDRTLVEACLDRPIGATPEALGAAGVAGLLAAGVDGDVAGLYLLTADARAAVPRALADAVRAAGGRWEEHDGRAHWSAARATSRS